MNDTGDAGSKTALVGTDCNRTVRFRFGPRQLTQCHVTALDDAYSLLERQHGVASDRELRRLGIDKDKQRRLIANGNWRRHSAGVVAASGAPVTWAQRAMAATLASSGLCLLSGRPAARLHLIDGFTEVDDVEVAIPHGAHYRAAAGVRVRRSRRLSAQDKHIIDSIPVTTTPVTLIHLAADGEDVEKALDSALRQRAHPSGCVGTSSGGAATVSFQLWCGLIGRDSIRSSSGRSAAR